MKLDCILSCVTLNSLYLDFVPIFIRSCKKCYPHIDVKIILVSHTIPNDLEQYRRHIILFEPLESIPDEFSMNIIKLLYPCIMNYKNGVMITNIDLIPMNKIYYVDHIIPFSNNKFIQFGKGNNNHIQNQYYMTSPPCIWKSIFNIRSIKDIKHRIIQVFKNNQQVKLYVQHTIDEWNKKTSDMVYLDEEETGFRRLYRGTFNLNNKSIENDIKNGTYSDYLCYRPMSLYSYVNYHIFNLL